MEEKVKKLMIEPFPFENLQREIQIFILSQLDVNEIGSCLRVSKGFREILENPRVWLQLLKDYDLEIPSTPQHYKQVFSAQYKPISIGAIIIGSTKCTYFLLNQDGYTNISSLPSGLQNSKLNRGGKSAIRFKRLFLERQHNCFFRMTERALQLFIRNNKSIVSGIILGTQASLTTNNFQWNFLKIPVFSVHQVVNEGANGLEEVCHSVSGTEVKILNNANEPHLIEFNKNNKAISKFFDHVSKNNSCWCCGLESTLKVLEQGNVETLLLSVDFIAHRYVLLNTSTNELEIQFEKIKNANRLAEKYQILDKTPLRLWISVQYPQVQLISIKSVSGLRKQFCYAFKIGGKQIYQVHDLMLAILTSPMPDTQSNCDSANEFNFQVEENITKLENISNLDFHSFESIPVLFTSLHLQYPWMTNWTTDKIQTTYGDFKVTLYKTDHEPMSKVLLKDYICKDLNGYIMDEELAAFIMSNEPGYETPIYWKDNYFSLLPSNIKSHHQWFLLGHSKSGSPLHIEPDLTSVWLTLLFGKKLWILFPPETDHSLLFLEEELSAFNWILQHYSDIKDIAIVCMQRPGETIYVPTGWLHVVLNVETSAALSENVLNARNYDRVLSSLDEEVVNALKKIKL